MIIELIILVIILVIFAKYKPIIKGHMGEGRVAKRLINLDFYHYRIINDIILNKGDSTSQIDHIVICPKGIVVIETKNYKGWIYGSEKLRNWTYVMYKKKYRFLNPIIQNKGHIKAIKENLEGYSNVNYHSVIVMAGSGEFKSRDKVTTPVICPNAIYSTIMDLDCKQYLKDTQIDDIYNQLQRCMRTEKGIQKEHVRNVKRKPVIPDVIKPVGPTTTEKCPWCGMSLTLRKGKYGEFWGCKGYPNCKYTKNFKGLE